MKTILGLLILILSLVFYQKSLAQVKFGLKAGYNASILSSSDNSGSKLKSGLNLGIYLDIKLKGRFHLLPEVNYSEQGQNASGDKIRFRYLNIPVLCKIDLGRVVNFQFGPQAGIFLSGDGKINFNGSVVDLKAKVKSDVGLVAGFGFNLGKHFNLGLRYNYGITNINEPVTVPFPISFPASYNRVINGFVGFTF